MTHETDAEHNTLIVDQFTQQAIPFSHKKPFSDNRAYEIMFEMSGVNPHDTVLDVACGPGLMACAFAARAQHVTGIDITGAMIDRAKNLQKEHNLSNVSWLTGDVMHLPFADESFSLVMTRFSFHHFLDPLAVFKEMMRVCKVNGAVMVIDVVETKDKQDAYNLVEKLRDPSHVSVLTPEGLIDMFTQLSVREVKTVYSTVEMELEKQLKTSFPRPGDDDRIRKIFKEDIGKDMLGVGAHYQGNVIHFAHPIAIVAGKK